VEGDVAAYTLENVPRYKGAHSGPSRLRKKFRWFKNLRPDLALEYPGAAIVSRRSTLAGGNMIDGYRCKRSRD
jgi:hypothetical protein